MTLTGESCDCNLPTKRMANKTFEGCQSSCKVSARGEERGDILFACRIVARLCIVGGGQAVDVLLLDLFFVTQDSHGSRKTLLIHYHESRGSRVFFWDIVSLRQKPKRTRWVRGLSRRRRYYLPLVLCNVKGKLWYLDSSVLPDQLLRVERIDGVHRVQSESTCRRQLTVLE